MKKHISFAAICALGMLLALNAVCRGAELPAPPTPADQQRLSQLGPGDSVSIQIFGQPDITSIYVGDDGTISVPLAGKVPVAGTSPVEAAARVAKALKDGRYFVDPHVTLLVTQSRSQLVSIVGDVQSAGQYPINPHTSLLDLLAQAGGVRDTASETAFVLRRDEEGHVNRYPVKLDGSTDLRDALPTGALMGGDSLLVPRAENFYVTGEVTSPGTYHIEPGMTVIQAVARAGGINERGSERRIQVKRIGKDRKYQIIKVKPGDLIQADDIIRVKESIF